MNKVVVVLYGPPGSGKGTQANLLAARLGLYHFDTGRFLEAIVHDPERQKEELVQRERKLFDTGMLMTPSFVLREVVAQVRRLNSAGWGIIFSGSPRTMYEADGLLPIFRKLYGKRNVFIFVLSLHPRESITRNSKRLVCKVCGHILLMAYHPQSAPKHCPICAGPLYRRTLDKPDIIKVRLNEYRDRTKPIFALIKKQGYHMKKINAGPAPYIVFRNINAHLKKALGN